MRDAALVRVRVRGQRENEDVEVSRCLWAFAYWAVVGLFGIFGLFGSQPYNPEFPEIISGF